MYVVSSAGAYSQTNDLAMFWVTILFYGPYFDSVMLSSLPNVVCWFEWVREFVSLGAVCI
jgi:hypothetical protein